MRNWNRTVKEKIIAVWKVFTVPMRNWNNPSGRDVLPSGRFLQYLWGIETCPGCSSRTANNGVFTVPMRNWNIASVNPSKSDFSVFTVPMRNWNFGYGAVNKSFKSVFTVPMRNWNSHTLNLIFITLPVFTVPMRNWNFTSRFLCR